MFSCLHTLYDQSQALIGDTHVLEWQAHISAHTNLPEVFPITFFWTRYIVAHHILSTSNGSSQLKEAGKYKCISYVNILCLLSVMMKLSGIV